ncbi:helix-turn-helix transcriptional regulator [Nonomuraea sediminis]|uniref:helix-turn-helix transcriptional regulator n=1 Tax=Nonomuraea sediminis TaxID=2835864 RepID=UPI001BDCC22A|nr:LuxR family transcriptional regulator [Nonomuraea sediminis]
MLWGRAEEQAALEGMLRGARAGESSALAVIGQPGIGKTALLEYASRSAGDMRIVRCTAAESEADLPFSGLHLLLKPLLHHVDLLPERQRDALRAAFGLSAAEPGDRFLVGLAVLTLLSEVAGERPLLCLIDDAHWLDQASADAVMFAARRLGDEGIVMLLGLREDGSDGECQGLPVLRLAGLDRDAARELLTEHGRAADLDELYAATGGNPLALIELTAADLPADAFTPVPLTGRIQAAFWQQVRRLPRPTQLMLLIAAACDTYELAIVMRAAASFGITTADLQPALDRGLISLAGTVVFRHPLVRAAAYHGAPLSDRLAVHAKLAELLDDPEQADRRAWHLAGAATGPDEAAAAALEQAAARAAARSGHLAAATAYERSASLSTDPARVAYRLTRAAEAALAASVIPQAERLAEQARASTVDPRLVARLDHVGAIVAFNRGEIRAAHDLQVQAAGRADREQAFWMLNETVYTAWSLPQDTALLAADLDRLGAFDLPPGDPLASLVWLHRWYSANVLGRETETFPPVADLLEDLRTLPDAARTTSSAGPMRAMIAAVGALLLIGHDHEASTLAGDYLGRLRESGEIRWLPAILIRLAMSTLLLGQHTNAQIHLAEAERMARDVGDAAVVTHTSAMMAYLAALTGDEPATQQHAEAALESGNVLTVAWVAWARAVLDLGLGRYEAALARFDESLQGCFNHTLPALRGLPDYVEVAARIGRPTARPLAVYREWAARIRRPAVDAIVSRCLALTSSDAEAESHYVAALRLHERDSRPMDHARTRLLFGEWLRRMRRKADAGAQLRFALETFESLGATPWAERARAELDATGAEVPRRAVPTPFLGLTPQELQIVRLAARGLSNREIATQLLLSPKTVAHHLYKAYPKLGISSRGDIAALML